MPPEPQTQNERIIAEFRANSGHVGGNFAGAPLLLLHTVGARSGQPRINPMMYLEDGDAFLVFASKAGSDRNPDQYWNLRATPDVTIEVGTQTIEVHAAELLGAERDAKFAIQAERYPGFAGYQQKTGRVIPVVKLERRRTLTLKRTRRSAIGPSPTKVATPVGAA